MKKLIPIILLLLSLSGYCQTEIFKIIGCCISYDTAYVRITFLASATGDHCIPFTINGYAVYEQAIYDNTAIISKRFLYNTFSDKRKIPKEIRVWMSLTDWEEKEVVSEKRKVKNEQLKK